MSDLRHWLATPDGMVTLLFTDIVGSTDRLAAVGEPRWLEDLRTHNRIVHRIVHAHSGAEVKFTGDGWMIAFAEPREAVLCADAIRHADHGAFRVRAGVHAGPAIKEGSDFLGRDVIVASRLASAAGADEVLVSPTVRLAVGGSDVLFGLRRTVMLKGLGLFPAFPLLAATRDARRSAPTA